VINNIIFRLTQTDKYQHILVSFVIMLTCFIFLSITLSLVLTLIVGIAKEVWDKYFGSGFCWYDMLANCIGIALASILYNFFI
jgi:VanZ family protein